MFLIDLLRHKKYNLSSIVLPPQSFQENEYSVRNNPIYNIEKGSYVSKRIIR